jgi:hypothetical protein
MSLDILRQESWSEHTWERIIDITRRWTLLWIWSLILAWCSSETPEQKEKREKSEREAQEKKEKEKNKLNQLLQEKIEHLKQGWYLKIKEELKHSKTLWHIILISHHWERWTVWVTIDRSDVWFIYWEDIYKVHLDERNLPKEIKEKGVRLLDLNDFEIVKK